MLAPTWKRPRWSPHDRHHSITQGRWLIMLVWMISKMSTNYPHGQSQPREYGRYPLNSQQWSATSSGKNSQPWGWNQHRWLHNQPISPANNHCPRVPPLLTPSKEIAILLKHGVNPTANFNFGGFRGFCWLLLDSDEMAVFFEEPGMCIKLAFHGCPRTLGSAMCLGVTSCFCTLMPARD